VAFDMAVRMLPRGVATALSMFLMAVTILVLWTALGISWSEVTDIGGQFETDSLWIPASLDLSVWMKVPKSWMMASLLIGVAPLLAVAVELALRNTFALIKGPDGLRDIPDSVTLGSGANDAEFLPAALSCLPDALPAGGLRPSGGARDHSVADRSGARHRASLPELL
jgi:hypothetical protein